MWIAPCLELMNQKNLLFLKYQVLVQDYEDTYCKVPL